MSELGGRTSPQGASLVAAVPREQLDFVSTKTVVDTAWSPARQRNPRMTAVGCPGPCPEPVNKRKMIYAKTAKN